MLFVNIIFLPISSFLWRTVQPFGMKFSSDDPWGVKSQINIDQVDFRRERQGRKKGGGVKGEFK